MPKQIVRMGDRTAHGGTVTGGCPTVLVDGKPVARVTDMHSCPMTTGTTPHVGGPIVGPGKSSVLVEGLPVAVVEDTVTCNGPPDKLILGCPNVVVGD